MAYVATFYSHYAAVLFVRHLKAAGIDAAMMPVPRRLSSSCGTGVRFETDAEVAALAQGQEGVERIFRIEGATHTLAYDGTGG